MQTYKYRHGCPIHCADILGLRGHENILLILQLV